MTADLPEGWATIRVGDYFHSWGGMTPSTSNTSYWGGNVPWVSSKDVKALRIAGGKEFITRRALRETRLRLCPVGSVLVVVRSGILAHTLPIAVADVPISINQDLKAFYSPDRNINEWLALVFRALAPEILTNNRKDGTTVQSVRYEELCDLVIPVPPTTEQSRITARLAELLQKVRDTRERLARVPTILKRFRQAVLAAACSGRLTEEWRSNNQHGVAADECLPSSLEMRKKLWLERESDRQKQRTSSKNAKRRMRRYEEPFQPKVLPLEGELPSTWVPATISQLALLDVGFAFPSAEFAENGVRLLRGENVEPGSLRWLDVEWWPHDKLAGFEHLMVQEGESVLAMDRPVISSGLKLARTKRDDVPCLLVQRVMRFKVPHTPVADFLHLRLQTADFLRHVSGGLTG